VIDSSIYLDRVSVEDHMIATDGRVSSPDDGLPDLEDTDGLLGCFLHN